MQIEIELVGKTNRWSYQQPRIRIGRDPSCDVSLPGNEYPMISREHLVLEVTAGGVTLSDPRSANGTYLNGSRVTTAQVSSGDTLRLGSDGPQLRIYLSEGIEQAAVQGNVTQVEGPQATLVAAANATVVSTDVRQSSSATMVGAQPGSDKGVRVSFGSPDQPETRQVPLPQAAAPSHPNSESAPGDDMVIEQKLNLVRNLLAVNLVGILILLGVLFYQNQQIAKNKDAVADLQRNAESAVKQLTPQLDARLSAFEKRVDGMDAKMQQAQDRFMIQMQQQTPKILDAYFDRKMQELKRQTSGLRP